LVYICKSIWAGLIGPPYGLWHMGCNWGFKRGTGTGRWETFPPPMGLSFSHYYHVGNKTTSFSSPNGGNPHRGSRPYCHVDLSTSSLKAVMPIIESLTLIPIERTLMSPRMPRGRMNRSTKIQLEQKLKLMVALPPFEGDTTLLHPCV